jgi:NAD kinase
MQSSRQLLLNKKIKNILIITKSMRFDRLAGLNRVITDTMSLEKLQQKRNEHEQICKSFQEIMESHSDFNIKVVKEVEVTPQMTSGQDLCLTIGGDNTFLRTAGTIINSANTAILGVNSTP